MRIDAKGMLYKELNEKIRDLIAKGIKDFELADVNGQRYIGSGINKAVNIKIDGVPGNDLGIFMDGPTIIVNGNAQDGVGNTMNSGKIVVKGDAGDVIGYAMRGGKIFIKGNVGYRVGIHMKEYKENKPIIVAGGTAGDFFGEYMAGGILILLGLNKGKEEGIDSDYIGTGMHGGVIYIRGEVKKEQIGKEVKIFELTDEDKILLEGILGEFCKELKLELKEIIKDKFIKLVPHTHRPYGELYSY